MAEPDLRSAAFPTLSDGQVEELARCASAVRRSCRDGEVLVGVGERDFGFFVVLEGELAIVDRTGDEERTVAVHHKGQFTGDVSHLTGTPSMLSAIARGDCEVLEIPRAALRQMLNQCPGL